MSMDAGHLSNIKSNPTNSFKKLDLKKDNRIMFVKKERGKYVVNHVNFVKYLNKSSKPDDDQD